MIQSLDLSPIKMSDSVTVSNKKKSNKKNLSNKKGIQYENATSIGKLLLVVLVATKLLVATLEAREVWQTPLIWAQGSSNLHHNTTHKVSFTAQLQKTPFLLQTPKVCFKRSFTSCISVRRVYFVACVCPRQTVGSYFMAHSVAAACNARIMKRRHRIC